MRERQRERMRERPRESKIERDGVDKQETKGERGEREGDFGVLWAGWGGAESKTQPGVKLLLLAHFLYGCCKACGGSGTLTPPLLHLQLD